MSARFCFNPKDPTFRYGLTEHLMEAGFVECPPPGEPIPPTLMNGPGGVLDQTAAALATTLRNKMGENPSEAQLKILSNMINGADLEALAKEDFKKVFDLPVARPVNVVESAKVEIPPTGAMSEPAPLTPAVPDNPPLTPAENLVAPDKIVTDPATGDTTLLESREVSTREMTDIPMVEIKETADAYTTRVFQATLKNTDKPTILNYGLKKQNVSLDMSKTKPLLIQDLQMLEIHDAKKE